MGIRYLAISIDSDDYDRISAGPCPTCGARPHARERDYDEPEPDILDLDKSWGYCQGLFDSLGLSAASELVAGDVTNTSHGWISYQGTVAPVRVKEVAAELTRVTESQVRNYFRLGDAWKDERSEQDFEYVNSHLRFAREFAEKVAGDDRGIVYYIG